MKHDKFAEIYDLFMKNVDYDSWYKFLTSYMSKKGKVIDLGCGTGELLLRFLKDGYSVTGIDISEMMLKISENKIKSRGFSENNYKLVEENIINYIHPEKVEYVICNFDTVNYLQNKSEFIKFLENSEKNMKKGGYLIFDIVTEEIFEEIFENGIFLDEEEEYTSIWRYEQINEKKHLVEIELFIRENKEDNLFRKYSEKQYKYIYNPEWVVKMATKKGFKIFDTATNSEFGEGRIFFVFIKK